MITLLAYRCSKRLAIVALNLLRITRGTSPNGMMHFRAANDHVRDEQAFAYLPVEQVRILTPYSMFNRHHLDWVSGIVFPPRYLSGDGKESPRRKCRVIYRSKSSFTLPNINYEPEG